MTKKVSSQGIKRVLVTGDIVLDCHIYQGSRETPNIRHSRGTMIVESLGGASMLYKLISAVAKAAAEPEKGAESPGKAVAVKPTGYAVHSGINIENVSSPSYRAFALWSPCPKEEGSKESVWRMVQPMGYGDKKGDTITHADISGKDNSKFDIAVLDDAALGFSFSTNQKAWPRPIREGKRDELEWVVLKMSSPVVQGDLWRTLSNKFSEKLVVIVSIEDIRHEEAGITGSLSWERAAQELLSELFNNTCIRDLLNCRHLIVSFGSAGAVWVSKNKGRHESYLIYDPAHLEGEWEEKIKGRSLGYMSCLTAGIVNQLAGPSLENDIAEGIIAGLSAMRQLHTEGHSRLDGMPGFPFDKIAEKIISPSSGYCAVRVPFPQKRAKHQAYFWTIIEGNKGGSKEVPAPLYGLARRVALFGARALSNIPYAQFGKLFTIDRGEVESLRGIQRLIKDYAVNPRPPRPLSIAVFGPPGSGKSFGIKQIAKAVLGKDVPLLEFNLSQFAGPDNLIGAFHQVRDEAIRGLTPFVFWDEFDSKEYMWLQYLLAPMQDGAFREGQISHPIGKCVFIFAGGTSYTMENFGPANSNGEEFRKFKLLKGPDFVSRLSGYLNVLGPNRRQKYDTRSGAWVNENNPVDTCFPIRRALLIRAVLEFSKDAQMEIDRGLLNALLEIGQYKHGARSLEAILMLSKGQRKEGLKRSFLPPREQISLHVDYDKFLSLVNRDLPFKMNSEVLAPSVHECYRRSAKSRGESVKYDREFSKLPDHIKASNIAAAARIPEVLSSAGLLIVPEDHPETLSLSRLNKIIEDNIELLAEAEHDGWMEQKYRDGWVYGYPRNDAMKIHDALISYKDLSEKNKTKDRDAVRSYPGIVKMAGFKIVENK